MLSMLMTTEYAPAEDRHELQQLLIHVAGGEREALAELYQRTRSAVYGLALSYLKNAQDAQDLTQDVYVPKPVPDASAAGGTPCRPQRGGMGRHSRAGVRFGRRRACTAARRIGKPH